MRMGTSSSSLVELLLEWSGIRMISGIEVDMQDAMSLLK